MLDYWVQIVSLVALILVANTLINAALLNLLGLGRWDSAYKSNKRYL